MIETECDQYLSPAQAARLLGVTPTRVRQLADGGQLVAVRSPLGRLIERGSVERRLADPPAAFGGRRQGASGGR